MRGPAAIALILIAACAAPSPSSEPSHAGVRATALDASTPTLAADTKLNPAPSSAHISEIEARELLADAFRQAGYRILYDVALGSTDVAFDGYDPRHSVGYEYIAAEERDTSSSVRVAAPKNVLVVGPASRLEVVVAAKLFLEVLARSSESSKKSSSGSDR